MRAKKVREEENPYVGNLLECLLGKMFNQWSAQRSPIVLPEVSYMLSPGGLGHVKCGLTTILSIKSDREEKKTTLRSGNRKELKYQNTNSSKISRLFKESVTFVCFFGFSSAHAGSSHLHFEIFISCKT